MKLVEIRHEPVRWVLICARCECDCGRISRANMGATLVAAVWRFRHARREAALVKDGFE